MMLCSVKLKVWFGLVAMALMSISAAMSMDADPIFPAGSVMERIQLEVQQLRAAPKDSILPKGSRGTNGNLIEEDLNLRSSKAADLLMLLSGTRPGVSFRKKPANAQERAVIIDALFYTAAVNGMSVIDYIEQIAERATTSVARTHYALCRAYCLAAIGDVEEANAAFRKLRVKEKDLPNKVAQIQEDFAKIEQDLAATDAEYFLQEQEKFQEALGFNADGITGTLRQIGMLHEETNSIVEVAQKAINDLKGVVNVADESGRKFQVVAGINYELAVNDSVQININGVSRPYMQHFNSDKPVGAWYVFTLLSGCIKHKQNAYGLDHNLVFENANSQYSSIGLFGLEQERNPLKYEQQMLNRIKDSLNNVVDVLRQVREMLSTSPSKLSDFYISLRDFYTNAFTTNVGECVPARLDRLYSWISSHIVVGPKTAQSITITIGPDHDDGTFTKNIKDLVVFFRNKKMFEFFKQYPEHIMSPIENIQDNAGFVRIFNRESFITWFLTINKTIDPQNVVLQAWVSLEDYALAYLDLYETRPHVEKALKNLQIFEEDMD